MNIRDLVNHSVAMTHLDIRVTLWLFIIAAKTGVGNGQTECEDTDTNACALLLTQKADLCTDPGLSVVCKRFCGLCPLICYQCLAPASDPFACNTTVACGQDQMCMRKEHQSPDGRLEYIFACETKEVCEGVGLGFRPMVGRSAGLDAKLLQSRDVSVKCCDIDKCNMLPITTSSTSTTTSTPVPTTTPPTTPTTTISPVNACHNDVAFVIDGSSTVGQSNHLYIIDFLLNVVQGLRIGPRDTQVALVEYSDSARVEWYLHDHVTNRDLAAAVTKIPFIGGSSATHAAIYLLRSAVFTVAHGDRKSAPNVVVIVTDGGTNIPDLLRTETQYLHGTGVKVIAVGVGNAIDQSELRTLASTTGEFFQLSSYSLLKYIQTRLVEILCSH